MKFSQAGAVRILRSESARSTRNLCAGKSLRKMPAAQRHVSLVAADLDLRAFALGGAVRLDTHHHGGLAPAMADGLDLHQVVGPSQQLRAAGEQFAAEVGAQAVA